MIGASAARPMRLADAYVGRVLASASDPEVAAQYLRRVVRHRPAPAVATAERRYAEV